MNYIYVALGGILGACARYFVQTVLPCSTLIVNLLGCAVIGFLTEYFSIKHALPQPVRLFLTVGFLGSFTTFSTFIAESGLLLQKQELLKALGYLLFSVIFGVLCYLAAAGLTRYFYESH
ncbi:camphor resistance B [Candidatus Termititenax spirochaetophilus]|uniref:Fluoride-specific ion channel FluC n=1 Tax=Candidatus Termititenax spirochaetophilus TaxID=2218522 RepID=A0A388T6K4_9BACT|nr:camphor resistance B [Candidatus Termititenax spirochaetophilus]